MELTVENGKGYVPATQNRPEDAPIGLIPVDALFSPVRRSLTGSRIPATVRSPTMTAVDGGRDQWRGDPRDAVALAARILQDQLQLFINFEEPREPSEGLLRELPFNKNLLRKVDELSCRCARPIAGRTTTSCISAISCRRPKARCCGPEFRPQVAQRDQGSAGPDGTPSRHGDPELAAKRIVELVKRIEEPSQEKKKKNKS